MFQVASIQDWLGPAALTGVVGIGVGALLNHWLAKRRELGGSDREVFDQMIGELDGFFAQLDLIGTTSLATPNPPSVQELLEAMESGRSTPMDPSAQRSIAAAIIAGWDHLAKGAALVGRLSERRYDGVREFGRRVMGANLSSTDMATLRSIASGRAVASLEMLAGAVPFPAVRTDATLLRTLAIVYRRRGPLSPTDRLWWRTPQGRAKDNKALAAALRPTARTKRIRKRRDIATQEEVEAMIDGMPEFDSLSEQRRNELVYMLINDLF